MGKNIKQPFAYYGGKQNMAPFIQDLLPISISHYCEPYCGGASLFWYLKQINYPVKLNSLNDIDNRITNFYKVVQDREQCKELYRKLRFTLYSEAEHTLSKEILNSSNGHYNDIDKAWGWFVNTNMSFAGTANGGYGYRIKGGTHNGNSANNKTKGIIYFHNNLIKTQIFNRDAMELIATLDSNETFFYIDTPYINTDQGHYLEKMDDTKFKKLIDLLNNIKGSFILSSYENEHLKEFKDIEIFKHNTICHAAKKKSTERESRTEIIIRKLNSYYKDRINQKSMFYEHPLASSLATG